MIERLLLFGATGDLAGRFLLPALAELCALGQLPDTFEVIGSARQELSDEEFRRSAGEQLERHAPDVPEPAREALLRRLRYRQIDVGSDAASGIIRDVLGSTPIAVYLALPPALFVPTITALRDAGLPQGSRIVVEKPFGEDLEGAVALDRLLAQLAGTAGEGVTFRVDHVLGMATVQNLLGLRFANRILEPVWNSTHIEQIEILWEETLALEGRAGYYDRSGALKDVMQNHMLQILALVAMEPPASLGERDLRNRKVEALRTVRPPEPARMAERTRRARYTAGRLTDTGGADGSEVPDYAAEEGVDPARCTETFAEVWLELESWRWAGTRFVLRAGKALQRRWKGVVVRFRPVPYLPFEGDATHLIPNELRIGLDGPECLELHLTGSMPGPHAALVPLVLSGEPPSAKLRAYSRVLLDVLSGGSTLSVRGDEAEQAWRIVTPVLNAWAADRVPLEEYPAGSPGLPRRRQEPGRAEPPR
jgi:glucose-6-phosphate 1-dehydrogenase